MATYEYVDTSGAVKRVEAANPDAAIASAPNRAKTSGVALVKAPASGTSAGSHLSPSESYAQRNPSKTSVSNTSGFDFSAVYDALNPYIEEDNDSSSYLEELKAAEEARYNAARSIVSSKFGRLKEEETQRGINDVASREGQLARIGGGASDTRFSSAAFGFIQSARDASIKRMNQLEAQEQEAIANLDFQAADRYRDIIFKEIDRQDQLEQQRFSRIMSVLGIGFQIEQNRRSEIALDLDIQQALRNTPVGQEVEIGGQTYRGLGSSGTTKLYQTTVVEGGVRREKVFGIDESTGQIAFSTDLGQGISPEGSSNDGRYTSSDIPPDVMSAVAEAAQQVVNGDMTNGQYYALFPDVSPSLLNSTLNPTLRYGE